MWCAACRADVAAELSSDNRRMLCARCRSELGTAVGSIDRPIVEPRLQDTERNARELLARWSTQHLLEPPIAAGPAAPLAPVATRPAGTSSELPAERLHRFDGPHAATATPTPVIAASDGPAVPKPKSDDTRERPRRRRVPKPHLAAVPSEDSTLNSSGPHSSEALPHDDMVRLAVKQPPLREGNWTTTIGQLCAYGGVAVLTLGTVMVLSGYFGGPANYAPTGWLVAAVGQMLLFLGVVTLVSGGMEQTVDEVAWRIDHLAAQIMHLEKTIDLQQAQLEAMRRREERQSRRGRSDAA